MLYRSRASGFMKPSDLSHLGMSVAAQAHKLCALEGSDNLDRVLAGPLSEAWLQDWQARWGVRHAHRYSCLGKLVGRACQEHSFSRRPNWSCSARDIGIDHAALWVRNRRPVVFTYQPYGLSIGQLICLGALQEEFPELIVSIEGRSWHFPGRTILVEIYRKEGRI